MTPFRLRNRFKKMLGKPGKAEIVRYPITFILPDGSEQTLEVEEHYSLLMASQGLPSPISTGRRAGSTCPDGGCDLCRIEVVDSSGLSPQKDFELQVMLDHAAGKSLMPFVGPVSGPINAEMRRSVGALLACCLRLRRTAAAGTSPAFCSAVVPALLVLSTRRKVANFLRVTEEADLKQMATDVADGYALRPVGCAERARRDRLKAKQERAR